MDDISYVLGLDLGQAHDPTAISIIRRIGSFGPQNHEEANIYEAGHLERLPLNTSYTQVITRVKSLLDQLPQGTELVIDATGVGRPVANLFDDAGIEYIGVMITGGNMESNDGRFYHVPKMTLVSGVQALLHSNQLRILDTIADADTLKTELQDFRIDFSASGHMTFRARSNKNDDLVLATSIACWRLKAGRESGIVRYYRSQAEASCQNPPLTPSDEAFTNEHHWRGTRRQVQTDANELTDLYFNTLDGYLAPVDKCATCQEDLGPSYMNDGFHRWHTGCAQPGG